MVAFIWLGTGVAAFPNLSTLGAAIAPFTKALLTFQNHQPKQLEESFQFHYDVYSFKQVLPCLKALNELLVPDPEFQDID
jgi:hypothetical protein